MRTIPLINLQAQIAAISEDVMSAIGRVVSQCDFILGRDVELFEDEFAASCGTECAIGVASGTDALHLALRALDVGPGDEVITAGNSFTATALAIAYTGAMPVYVDVNPADYTIDVDLVERAITSKTKAIVPVHLYGQPAQMSSIVKLAKQHGLRVVEDACQAHGALDHDHPVGSFGDAGCFSFYPGKNLGGFGDGGAIVTSNEELAAKIQRLRNYGQKTKHQYAHMGYNSRLDTLQAAVLRVKLKYLESWNDRRRVLATQYNELLDSSKFILPLRRSEVWHVYHLYVVQHPKRDEVIKHLQDRGIACGIHYPHPLHASLPFINARCVPHDLPVCTQLSKRILSLPICPELSDSDLFDVVAATHSYQETRARVF